MNAIRHFQNGSGAMALIARCESKPAPTIGRRPPNGFNTYRTATQLSSDGSNSVTAMAIPLASRLYPGMVSAGDGAPARAVELVIKKPARKAIVI